MKPVKTKKAAAQPNRAARRAAAYAARREARPATAKEDPGLRRYFASCISVRSIPQDDLGTAYRTEIDACLRKNLVVCVQDGAPALEFRTRRAQDLAAKHGIILRYGFPGQEHWDVYVPAHERGERDQCLAGDVYPRLYASGRALPKVVDDGAFVLSTHWERRFDTDGIPESRRVGTCLHFFDEGWFVRLIRCPKGRYPTDWIIDDVSPTDRYCDEPEFLAEKRGVIAGRVEDEHWHV